MRNSNLTYKIYPHTLQFRFAAGTSRGVLHTKNSWYVQLFDPTLAEGDGPPHVAGTGECSVIDNLSIDAQLINKQLIEQHVCHALSAPDFLQYIYSPVLDALPALRMALETAWLDWVNGGEKVVFRNAFTANSAPIPINGLVWMGDAANMRKQIADKLDAGFTCLKLKVGAIDFATECAILAEIRRNFSVQELVVRADANGAFTPDEAVEKLKRLSDFGLHSIEQPVKAGQPELMAALCAQNIVPIALDEELLGVYTAQQKADLLSQIRPQYIIVKPSQLGGFRMTDEWVAAAEQAGIGWWATSALEANIGLNAICQYTYERQAKGYQGLGTGQLYHNNIASPLTVANGHIFYDHSVVWGDMP